MSLLGNPTMSEPPKPGEVWGVPSDSLTWMRCESVDSVQQWFEFADFWGDHNLSQHRKQVEDWQKAGAVNITEIVSQ